MEINAAKENDILVVGLNGNFDIASAGPADKKLTEILDAGELRMLLDFSQVPYIASSGLRVLLKVAQRLKSNGGKFGICCVNDTVSEVLVMTGFDKILSIYESREKALESLT